VSNLKFGTWNGVEQLGVSFHSEDSRSQNAAGEGGFSDSSAADEIFPVAGRNGK
jgi:hypothetical protein